MASKKKVQTETVPDNLDIQEAIAEGRALIDHGKSKIEAAMAIYRRI